MSADDAISDETEGVVISSGVHIQSGGQAPPISVQAQIGAASQEPPLPGKREVHLPARFSDNEM